VCTILKTVIFLSGTILANKQQQIILLKSSIIPLLAARVQTSSGHDIASQQSLREMHHMAKKAEVLMNKGKGYLIFIKEEEYNSTNLELQTPED
jgi:hypothetical protein